MTTPTQKPVSPFKTPEMVGAALSAVEEMANSFLDQLSHFSNGKEMEISFLQFIAQQIMQHISASAPAAPAPSATPAAPDSSV